MPISPTYSDVGVNISFQFYNDSCLTKYAVFLQVRSGGHSPTKNNNKYRAAYQKSYKEYEDRMKVFYDRHPEAMSIKCVIYKLFMMCVCVCMGYYYLLPSTRRTNFCY